MGNDVTTTVQSGATLDISGAVLTVANLQGSGQIINSGFFGDLSLIGHGNFSGIISGPLDLTINGGSAILSGNNAYTGGTTIASGAQLILGTGGASGSVVGNIVDNGNLAINRSDTFTLSNVSGAGMVSQGGSGTTILGNGLTYAGGTSIAAGTLSVGNPSALGAGALTITGGELLASATETITGHNLSVAANQSVALTSLFTVSGPTPLQYQVWLSSPADGSVSDGIGAIATGTAVNETSLNGVNFNGGGVAGSDALFMRSFDGQWSSWAKATLTDLG